VFKNIVVRDHTRTYGQHEHRMQATA